MTADQDLTEITAKRLPHKRAVARLGIMTELILVRSSPGPAYFTDFWDQTRYRWPAALLAAAVDGLRIASANAPQRYRAKHHHIHGIAEAAPESWLVR